MPVQVFRRPPVRRHRESGEREAGQQPVAERLVDVAHGIQLVRNVHQAFGYGLLPGLAFAGLAVATHGWTPEDLHGHPGHERMKTLASYYRSGRVSPQQASNATGVDRKLTFDKVTNVHYSGTSHDEDQPAHLLVHTEVCSSICGPEYGHPCTRFCPANVYEIA